MRIATVSPLRFLARIVLLGFVALIGSLGASEVAAVPTVTLAPPVEVAPGGMVDVPITATDVEAALSFDLVFDYDPTVVTATAVSGTVFTTNFGVTSNLATPGKVLISLVKFAQNPPLPDLPPDGILAEVTFQAIGSAGEFSNLTWVSALVQEDPLVTEDGRITIVGVCVPSPEICNGVDDDCDNEVDEGFEPQPTMCGTGACAATGMTACVDGEVVDDCTPGTPAQDDTSCNNVDDDCNGQVDDGFVPQDTSCGVGACMASGTTSCVNGQTVDDCTPGTPAQDDTSCNNVDDDCNGQVDDGFVPQDTDCGVGACMASGTTSCVNGQTVDDCTPGTPAQDDTSCNNVDDDCNGQVDDGFVPQDTDCGVGACMASGTTSCVNGQTVDDCTPGTPAQDDTSCNNVDDDCNGQVDDGFVPQDTDCGVGACIASGTTSCVNGQTVDDCTPGTPAQDDTSCNNVDDDCNGQVDDGFVSTDTTCGAGDCAATGMLICVSGQVEDTCTPGTGAPNDLTCDGVDDDCNGQIDDGFVPTDTSCGVGACAATGMTACVDGDIVDDCTPGTPAQDDTSCNNVDDDCNGQVDDGFVSTDTTCGAGDCAATGMLICVSGQVEDTCTPGTGAPTDLTCDGVDDDCNGQIDDGFVPRVTTCGDGACASVGLAMCVDGEIVDDCTPGTPAQDDTSCNNVDDDCNGQVDDGFVSTDTTCGAGDCAGTGMLICVSGQVEDTCTSGTGAPNDLTCNGVDDDCNGQIDDGFIPGVVSCGEGACTTVSLTTCVDGQVVDDCTPGTPAPDDTSCNNVDDDCNGEVDDGFVAEETTCGEGACQTTGSTSCVNGDVLDSCTAGNNEPDDDTCDGVDDDCDGLVDEDFMEQDTTCGEGACASTGVLTCVDGQTVDTCQPVGPPDDVTCDGIDDNCNGQIDEDYMPLEIACGIGACVATGMTACENGDVIDLCEPGDGAADDSVCNLVDDDCDGEVDEDATDCLAAGTFLRTFVSSTLIAGDLGGVAGADATCQWLADGTGLGGHYKAWVSDTQHSPATTFVNPGQPYGLVTGVKVADDFLDLTDGSVDAPIDLDENGIFRGQDTRVWTGTTAEGLRRDGALCNDWTTTSTLFRGGHGRPDRTDSTWSLSGAADCDHTRRLYCFEQGVLPEPVFERRLVFVSSSTSNGDLGGIVGGDETCNDLAAAAGLPGTYKAWVSDGTTGPTTSFQTVPDVPYTLIDGTVIASGFGDLIDGILDAPIDLDENGAFRGDGTRLWTGTNAFGVPLGSNCNGWQSGSALLRGAQGRPDETDTRWSFAGGADCSRARRLYCFQQGL